MAIDNNTRNAFDAAISILGNIQQSKNVDKEFALRKLGMTLDFANAELNRIHSEKMAAQRELSELNSKLAQLGGVIPKLESSETATGEGKKLVGEKFRTIAEDIEARKQEVFEYDKKLARVLTAMNELNKGASQLAPELFDTARTLNKKDKSLIGRASVDSEELKSILEQLEISGQKLSENEKAGLIKGFQVLSANRVAQEFDQEKLAIDRLRAETALRRALEQGRMSATQDMTDKLLRPAIDRFRQLRGRLEFLGKELGDEYKNAVGYIPNIDTSVQDVSEAYYAMGEALVLGLRKGRDFLDSSPTLKTILDKYEDAGANIEKRREAIDELIVFANRHPDLYSEELDFALIQSDDDIKSWLSEVNHGIRILQDYDEVRSRLDGVNPFLMASEEVQKAVGELTKKIEKGKETPKGSKGLVGWASKAYSALSEIVKRSGVPGGDTRPNSDLSLLTDIGKKVPKSVTKTLDYLANKGKGLPTEFELAKNTDLYKSLLSSNKGDKTKTWEQYKSYAESMRAYGGLPQYLYETKQKHGSWKEALPEMLWDTGITLLDLVTLFSSARLLGVSKTPLALPSGAKALPKPGSGIPGSPGGFRRPPGPRELPPSPRFPGLPKPDTGIPLGGSTVSKLKEVAKSTRSQAAKKAARTKKAKAALKKAEAEGKIKNLKFKNK
jgi:hypothetical protein